MRSVILGTAGHIDHGKTALVAALAGVDTDRLKEEKARGITIELGFAELTVGDSLRFGVVDVPGHEAFVRAMVAGAAGMDVVVLVVAADEGVMPQTREHLAIVELLDVPELVVAITKCDASDDEWLELVDADIEDVLDSTRYAGAPRVRTSAHQGTGLDALTDELMAAAERARVASDDDLTRLPLDRVFTIQGTGTVVTGSLWTGTLSQGDRVRIVPGDHGARVRGLQVHGRESKSAVAGDRTAAALTGDGGDRDLVGRGATLVTDPAWSETWMLTCRVSLLADTAWRLDHNQRVHVHLGTSDVLARVAMLEEDRLAPGSAGWVQLRLESPLVARAGDRLVLRSYSPMTTIGGGVVGEPLPAKRNRLSDVDRAALDAVVSGDARAALHGALALAGWSGLSLDRVPIVTGLAPTEAADATRSLSEEGLLRGATALFAPEVRSEAEELLIEAVDRAHAEDRLRSEASLAAVRGAIPAWASSELAEAALGALVDAGRLEAVAGGVRRPGFVAEPDSDQRAALDALGEVYRAAGLAAPLLDELPAALRARHDFMSLLGYLERGGTLRAVADGWYVSADVLDEAEAKVATSLGGRKDLSPGDFRDVLNVTRKHLIPLLTHFDARGTTVRDEGGRAVPAPS
ncbi:MAG: selenocysteine-specific translation elongation factor [Gemmatimonadota bacterium]